MIMMLHMHYLMLAAMIASSSKICFCFNIALHTHPVCNSTIHSTLELCRITEIVYRISLPIFIDKFIIQLSIIFVPDRQKVEMDTKNIKC